MKTLLLMRHAKSSWEDTDITDHDRVLNPRGLRDAPRMGRLLRDLGLIPDQIVSSSAVRARTTAELVAKECGADDRLSVTPQLYHAQIDDWREILRDLPPALERVLCIGHNPGLEEFLSMLAGHHVRMPTAAIARLDLRIDDWPEVERLTRGDLVEHWCPKDLN